MTQLEIDCPKAYHIIWEDAMLGELDSQQIEELLHSEVIARVGCHAGGMTYVVPITYAYDGESIVGHSTDGLKIRLMRTNPEVCIEVDHMENMANWRSVIAWGTYEELDGAEAHEAMNLLIERLRPLLVSQSSTPTHGAPTGSHQKDTAGHVAIIYRIRLKRKSGRFERR
jgi:nitroimidazol reductase NimA-like FMN-containing flavoprotein (pyridoxamine 5'-phosphate oxidase superfamily)